MCFSIILTNHKGNLFERYDAIKGMIPYAANRILKLELIDRTKLPKATILRYTGKNIQSQSYERMEDGRTI